MSGIRGMKRRVSGNTSSIKIRIDGITERDLRLLYSHDKIISGSMSFNQWIVMILNEKVIRESGRLNALKRLIIGDDV